MKTTIQELDGNMVASLEGSLDTSVVPETEKAMSPLYDCDKDFVGWPAYLPRYLEESPGKGQTCIY